MDEQTTILVRVTGRDRPGITAALMTRLHELRADVLDVEQISVRDHLHLAVLITVPEGRDLLKELLLFGWEEDLQLDFEVVSKQDGAPALRRAIRYAVTLLGKELGPDDIAAAARLIATHGGNIDRIFNLARYPVIAYELLVSGGDIEAMRRDLLGAAMHEPFDIAVQREGLARRALRLVALDVDSTLIRDEAIDLIADEVGVGAEVAALTAAAMAGELDYAEALARRVALFAGADAVVLERARERMTLTPGARTFVRTLKRLGFTVMVVSGGFTIFTDSLASELAIAHAFANELEVVDGRLTGSVVPPIVDRGRKAQLMADVARREGITMDQTVAVGDGANDLDMLSAAGLGIAFNAKPVVRAAVDTAVTVPYLDAILFVLGIRRDEVESLAT